MKTSKLVQATAVVLLALGIAAGCESMGGGASMSADQVIAAAKEANQKAASEGNEWRDTGKIIEAAEKALADGNKDEALKLAKQALEQAENALKQATEEAKRI